MLTHFILTITLLFTQILLLILSKINVNYKNCGVGLVAIFVCCGAASANCFNQILGNCIMYLMCGGAIIAIFACYYKIKGIDEIEKKKKDSENDIELQDIEHE